MDSLQIVTCSYQARTAAIVKIRKRVFQEEQNISADLEFDGFDADAVHLLAYLENRAVATARIREIDTDTAKLERLAVLPEYRKQGIGTRLTKTAIATIARQGKSQVIIHAQAYIAPLYQQLGFKEIGDRFSEAGIAHVKMILPL